MGVQTQTSLDPVLREKDRIFGPKAYIALWWGDAIYVGAFMNLVPPFGELNLYQAFMALFLANLLVAVLFAINGAAGWKYGIPMVVPFLFRPDRSQAPLVDPGSPRFVLVWYPNLAGCTSDQLGDHKSIWL